MKRILILIHVLFCGYICPLLAEDTGAVRYQDSILKVIQERYETDAKTAEDEYELWSALYEDSAEVTEKSNKKIDYINRKIKNHLLKVNRPSQFGAFFNRHSR